MATSTYEEALARLLAHENGYSNRPSDPGGPTFGIADWTGLIIAAYVGGHSIEKAAPIF